MGKKRPDVVFFCRSCHSQLTLFLFFDRLGQVKFLKSNALNAGGAGRY